MRLTKKYKDNYCSINGDFKDLYDKLGQLENLLEKYCIDNLIDLNVILAEYFAEIKERSIKSTVNLCR